jgi:hypothetical protein
MASGPIRAYRTCSNAAQLRRVSGQPHYARKPVAKQQGQGSGVTKKLSFVAQDFAQSLPASIVRVKGSFICMIAQRFLRMAVQSDTLLSMTTTFSSYPRAHERLQCLSSLGAQLTHLGHAKEAA